MTAVLASYFGSGASVCPFARITNKVFFADTDLSSDTVGHWVSVLLAREVSVVYATGLERGFDQAREWCREMFSRLRTLARSDFNPPLDKSMLPFMSIGVANFYTIGMGPQYPVEHPRHAPVLCLVSVNEASIKEVPYERRIPIRKEMARRAGAEYNPDEIWLPLNLEKK